MVLQTIEDLSNERLTDALSEVDIDKEYDAKDIENIFPQNFDIAVNSKNNPDTYCSKSKERIKKDKHNMGKVFLGLTGDP